MSSSHRTHDNVLFLFDVDGTLTKPRGVCLCLTLLIMNRDMDK